MGTADAVIGSSNSFSIAPGSALLIVLGAAVVAAGLIAVTRPLLVRHALANPNERSSHVTPTPQGGGVGVIVATVVAVSAASVALPWSELALSSLVAALAAAIALAALGLVDDLRGLGVAPRLAIQALAVAAVVWSLPSSLQAIPGVAWWIDRPAIFLALLWFVNVANFMDGVDWMTVAEVVPITAALSIGGWMGALPQEAMIVALALLGAMLGFAPFNKPVARLFLGDVGSLPIGLLLGWMLVLLAGSGHLVAAVLLPLYYLADATITLMLRRMRGERIWQAHRSHYYQRATVHGLAVRQVVGRVFAANVVLAALALATIATDAPLIEALAAIGGIGVVASLLGHFGGRGESREA